MTLHDMPYNEGKVWGSYLGQLEFEIAIMTRRWQGGMVGWGVARYALWRSCTVIPSHRHQFLCIFWTRVLDVCDLRCEGGCVSPLDPHCWGCWLGLHGGGGWRWEVGPGRKSWSNSAVESEKKKPKRQGWARLRRKRYVNRVRGWRVMGWQNKRGGTRVKKPKKMRQSIRSGRLSQQTETLHSRTCKILP